MSCASSSTVPSGLVHHVDALDHGQEGLGGIEVRGGVLDPDDLGELPLVVGRVVAEMHHGDELHRDPAGLLRRLGLDDQGGVVLVVVGVDAVEGHRGQSRHLSSASAGGGVVLVADQPGDEIVVGLAGQAVLAEVAVPDGPWSR
jgi:hypothetical protein